EVPVIIVVQTRGERGGCIGSSTPVRPSRASSARLGITPEAMWPSSSSQSAPSRPTNSTGRAWRTARAISGEARGAGVLTCAGSEAFRQARAAAASRAKRRSGRRMEVWTGAYIRASWVLGLGSCFFQDPRPGTLPPGTPYASSCPVMALSLKPEHLKRYKDIARLLIQHGRADLVKAVDADLPATEIPQEVGGDPERLARDLEALGPTFIKLGQLLSTRSDFLPAPYLDALARLQDKVEPFSFAEVEEIVSSELGVRLSKAFRDFDSTPLAAASLGQVHRAELRDGRPVAVKVQRPGIRQVILEDLDAFGQIAALVDKHTEVGRRFAFQDMLEEFRKTLLRELDYRREAVNLVTLA